MTQSLLLPTWMSVIVFLTAPLAPAYGQFVEPEVEVLFTLLGEEAGDRYGWAAESLGDATGDGLPEYVITAITHTEGGTLAGKAFVYDGADGSVLNTVVGQPFNVLGFGVAAGGDADGDGVPDYALGAPSFPGLPSRVLILSGASHTVLHEIGDPSGSRFGFDLHFIDDVDGDGSDDLVVGAATDDANGTDAGRVDLISGADGSVIWSQQGLLPGAALGTAVSSLGDLNGDGIAEVGAGAAGAGQELGRDKIRPGEAYVLDGATGVYLQTFMPNGTGGAFGQFFVHDAGDVNGDGLSDVYVGDFADKIGGRAYAFSGADGERLRLVNAENPGDGLGIGRGAGDVDGDGFDDLLVGAFTSSEGATLAGKCYVVSGKNGQYLRTYTATLGGARVGFDVVRLGDANADGWTDFLLTGQGVAYVVSGAP